MLDTFLRLAEKDDDEDKATISFRKLLFEFQDTLEEDMKENLKTVIDHLRQDELMEAISAMDTLSEPYLSKARKLVELSL